MSGPEVPEEFAALAAMLHRAETDADRPPPDPFDPAVIALRRRRRRRRGLIAAIVAFVVLASVGTYIPVTLLAPLPAATITLDQPRVRLPDAVTIAVPQIGVSAVSVLGAEDFDGTTGTDGILAAGGGNEPHPIASITKLVTALVILDATPIVGTDAGPTITFSKADVKLYEKYYVLEATVQPMDTGSTLSLRDALQLMLVVSATNYAEAVSSWAFGSPAGFRAAAKAWLEAKGLSGTTIVEATGIDPGNTSTPTDLIGLAKLALADPVVAGIVRQTSLNVPGFAARPNTNALLGIDGVVGIKTGTLEEAGSCLLFAAVVSVGAGAPITIIGVVLGGFNHAAMNSEIRRLLASITAGFHEVPLVTAGQELGSYTTPWGSRTTVVARDAESVLTWSDNPVTVTVQTNPVTTTARRTPVGSVTFVAGKEAVTVPLVLKSAIKAPDAWWRLTHPAELLGW